MSWVDGLRHRMRVWLHSEAYQWEQAEERRFHREMEDEARSPEASGGATRRDARAPSAASTPLSDPGRRGGRRPLGQRVLERLRQDLGYAMRGLVRSPGFTLLAALTLALGVGANAAVFSVLDRVFGQPPAGVDEPDGLRRLYIELPEHPRDPGMIFPSFNYPAFSAVDDAVEGGGQVAAWAPSAESTIREGDRELTVRRSFVTHDYFSVLGVGAALGRLFGPDEERVDVPAPVAVISYAFWERAFGSDPDVLGRTLELDSATFSVIGVAVEGFSGLDLSYTDVFFPLSTFPAEGQLGLAWYEWIGNYLHAVARLPEGGEEEPLEARATAGYQRQVRPERGAGPVDPTATVLAGSIIEARGPHEHDQGVSISVRIAAVSAIVLLIACANVAGLLLVRAIRRRREIAVRMALGVSRARLVSQLLTESFLVASLSGGAAVFIAVWGGAVLRSLLLPDVVWAQPAVEARTVAFALVAAVAVGLAAGLVPALQSRRVEVGEALKAGVREGGPPRTALRTGLLITQAALSVLLLVGAGLFLRSLQNVAALRLGYDVDELAFVSLRSNRGLPADWADALRGVAARLRETPGVEGVTFPDPLPMMGRRYPRIFLPGRDSVPRLRPGEYPTVASVEPGYFAVAGTRIVMGRAFAEGEEDGVVVVNETMARTFWPAESALGQCMILDDAQGACQEVVGVAEDARRTEVIEEPTLQLFRPSPSDADPWGMLLRVDRSRWDEVATAARNEMSRHFEPRIVNVMLMTERLEPQLRPWRLGAQLFTAFGVLALVVTIVGVYTVMAYAVSQRTHEMGVRIALGARLRDVLSLVVGQGLRVVALGAGLGIAIALALGRIVEAPLYGVTPRDPVAIAAAAAVLLATGAAACLIPAWRAGRVDPVRALSAE